MTITGKPVTTLPEAERVADSDYILVFSDGTLMRAAGTLFRGDPGQNATINGVNALTLAAGDNVAISQSGGTVTLSANISGVFIFKGPATLATLPALTAANLGFTYNMTEAFTTTADFIEGAGKAYSAGADVAICDAGNGVYRYNVLSVDLSGLVPATRQINGHALSSDVALSKSDVGLGNVDNTSDANKPISTAAQTALNAKQDKLSVTGAANKGVYVSASGVVSAMTHTLDADVPSNAVFTDTTYTPASAAPLMDGAAAVGNSAKYARENHVHPTDTSRASAADVAAIKALLQNAVLYRTASGNPATFSDGYPENLRKLSVTLTPSQSGSGDPSPTNVRPISGVSSVAITRAGTGGANSQTVTVSFADSNDNPLTVYAGTLDATSGTLTVTHVCATITGQEADWSTYRNTALLTLPMEFARDSSVKLLQGVCSHLPTNANGFIQGPSGYTTALVPVGTDLALDSSYSRIQFYFTDTFWGLTNGEYSGNNLTVASVKAFFAGLYQNGTPVQICYKLRNPFSVSLAAQQLAALSGYNSVSADSGSVSVEYRADPSVTLGGGT